MSWIDSVADRLGELEMEYGVGEHGSTTLMIGPDSAHSETPETDLDIDDIRVTKESGEGELYLEYDEIVTPHHRPPYYRDGLVLVSYSEVAWMWENMPDDVRDRELEYRLENGEPIPPFLQD